MGANGELFPIDFEYEAVAPIPFKFVVFRGLHQALSAVSAASSADPASGNIAELVLEVMRLAGVPLNQDELSNYIGIEATLQDNVVGVPISETAVGLRTARLRVDSAGSAPPTSTAPAGDVLQLFWKTKDSEYQEPASASAAVFPGFDRQLIAVAIPPIDPSPDSLRLDPCTRKGVFNLSAVRLFDALGDCIWAWDGDRARFDDTRSLTFADASSDGGVIAYSEGGDPSLTLPVRPEVVRGLGAGGRLEVEMSWPELPDYLMIGRRLLDANGYRERIRSLEAECRALAQSRDAEAARHAEIRTRYELVAAELVRTQSQNAEFAETQRLLTAEVSERKGTLANLERAHSALLEENQQALMSELSQSKRELISRTEELSIVREERDRLTAEVSLIRRNSDRAVATANPLNRELQEQIRIVKDELRNVSSERYALQRENRMLAAEISRIDRLEQRLTEMYQSRIWRTLVTLSSPLSALLVRRRK